MLWSRRLLPYLSTARHVRVGFWVACNLEFLGSAASLTLPNIITCHHRATYAQHLVQ